MANWLTYRIKVGDDVLVLADEEAQELIKNETERSKKADAQTASFLESTTTNGIIRNSKSDPFGQTAIGGMKVVIDKGDLIINGNIKNHARLTRTYNVTQENRTEVFLYRFDSVTNEITGLWRDCIIQGDIILSREDKTELPLRSSGYYDILICKITIPAGATEITQDMIGDFRQNEYYCGYAKNILVDIDETLTKSDAAADAAAVGTVISDLRNETRTRDIITEKRITNLEAGLPAERWSVDDSVAYIKEVPENALPFASVDLIGGMTRKTANLIPFVVGTNTLNGITHTVNSDGSRTLTGTATADVYLIFFNTLAQNEHLPAGNYHISTGSNIYVAVEALKDGVFVSTIKSGEGAFTIDYSDYNDIRMYLFIKGGSPVNTTVRLMLNEGTTALPYEPYFDGLRSAPVTEVESVGVNLLPMEDVRKNVLGCDVIVSNGVITIKGTAIGSGGRLDPISTVTLPAGTYFLTVDGIAADKDFFLSRIGGGNNIVAYNRTYFTLTEKTQLVFGRNFASGNTYSITARAHINRGTTALPYTPYRSDTLPIHAEVQALDGYGWGINDTLYNYIDFEKEQYVQTVDKDTWNGTESTIIKAENIPFFRVTLSSASKQYASGHGNKGICSLYNVFSGVQYSKCPDMSIMIAPLSVSNAKNVVFVKDSRFTTAEEFKAFLVEQSAKGNPLEIAYELAEPVITDISDMLPDDNLIGVEGGGTVTMVNEYGYDVPSEITYQLKGAEA